MCLLSCKENKVCSDIKLYILYRKQQERRGKDICSMEDNNLRGNFILSMQEMMNGEGKGGKHGEGGHIFCG